MFRTKMKELHAARRRNLNAVLFKIWTRRAISKGSTFIAVWITVVMIYSLKHMRVLSRPLYFISKIINLHYLKALTSFHNPSNSPLSSHIFLNIDSFSNSRNGVSMSLIMPPSRTRTLSQSMIVFTRCAIVKTVNDLKWVRMTFWMDVSVRESIDAVASSIIIILDLRTRARARQINARSPYRFHQCLCSGLSRWRKRRYSRHCVIPNHSICQRGRGCSGGYQRIGQGPGGW